jgi:hypothetical protein
MICLQMRKQLVEGYKSASDYAPKTHKEPRIVAFFKILIQGVSDHRGDEYLSNVCSMISLASRGVADAAIQSNIEDNVNIVQAVIKAFREKRSDLV